MRTVCKLICLCSLVIAPLARVNAQPAAVSVTPSSGSGLNQTFTFNYSDSNGSGALNAVYALFNQSLTVPSSCTVYYYQPAKTFYLVNDAGTDVQSLPVGSTATVQNSQCVLNGSGSSVTAAGNSLTMTLALTFQPAFTGTKTTYLYAGETGGASSGWQARGTWTPSGAVSTPPTADSVTPNSGSGAAQTFSFQFSSGRGSSAINIAFSLFNSTLNGAGACYAFYYAPTSSFYLVNDSGTGFSPLPVGSSGSLQNSQCTLNGNGSSVTGAGNVLTVTLALVFKPAFAGTQNVYMYASDNANLSSGWQTRGTWTVPAGGGVAPGTIGLPANFSVPLGQSVAFPITLGTPAPAGGVVVSLTASTSYQITISPAAVYIPQGATTPAVQPRLTGFNIGAVNITASAPGYATAVQSVWATATVTFSPGSITIQRGANGRVLLALSSAAPPGTTPAGRCEAPDPTICSVTVSLYSENQSVALVQPSLSFFPDGSSQAINQVPIVGIGPGTTVIHAGAPPYIPDTTLTVTVQ